MLHDLGLATEEQIQKQKDLLANWSQFNGCIGSRICENCRHIISDSICLCSPCFICPNCKRENGREIRKMIEEQRKIPLSTPLFDLVYTDGIKSS